MKVEVKPIPGRKWHGKSGKESFKRPEVIRALVDPATMEYATGLTQEDREEFKAKGVTYDLSPNFNPEVAHPFWDGSLAMVKLDNSTMFFDESKTLDKIKISIMKASKLVANSEKDWDDGLYPEALFIIRNETEESEIKAGKIALKNKAIIACSQISRDKKVQIVMLMTGKNVKKASDKTVEVELDKAITSNPTKVLGILDRDSDVTSTHAMVLEAIDKGIFVKKALKITYMDSLLGVDVEDAVTFLNDTENQDLKVRIMETLNV